MSGPVPSKGIAFHLAEFHEGHAAAIETWVTTEDQLRWLAPGTDMPLTAEKIIGWHQPGRKAFVLVEEPHASPLGYAELNPMRQDPGHFWLGHAIVRPDLRKRGIGKMFVRALVRHAFERLGAERISLIVFPENTAAVECYRRVGFIPVREEYHEFGTKRTRYRFLRLEIRRSSERSTR